MPLISAYVVLLDDTSRPEATLYGNSVGCLPLAIPWGLGEVETYPMEARGPKCFIIQKILCDLGLNLKVFSRLKAATIAHQNL